MRGFCFALMLAVGVASVRPVVAQDAVGARSAALASLFKEMWEDRLKRHPEFASEAGDRRYGSEVTDLSAKAANDELAAGREFLVRLAMTDMKGFSAQDQQMAALMQEALLEEEEEAKFKEWEMPVNRCDAIEANMAEDVAKYPFGSMKDYDAYIERLKKYPAELRQATENMLAGIDDGRIPAVGVLEKALSVSAGIAAQKPEESVFAEPLKRFPATVASMADRKRIAQEMVDAITDDVLPAYARFANFLRVREIPEAKKEGGAWATKNGDSYDAFCVRRSATWEKLAAIAVR